MSVLVAKQTKPYGSVNLSVTTAPMADLLGLTDLTLQGKQIWNAMPIPHATPGNMRLHLKDMNAPPGHLHVD